MARVNKIRKEKLSIYLARDGSKPDSDLIKLENVKQPIEMDLLEAESARLYIKIFTVSQMRALFVKWSSVTLNEY